MKTILVENEMDHELMPITGCFRVCEGNNELRHVYANSADEAAKIFCEGNGLCFDEVSVDVRTTN